MVSEILPKRKIDKNLLGLILLVNILTNLTHCRGKDNPSSNNYVPPKSQPQKTESEATNLNQESEFINNTFNLLLDYIEEDPAAITRGKVITGLLSASYDINKKYPPKVHKRDITVSKGVCLLSGKELLRNGFNSEALNISPKGHILYSKRTDLEASQCNSFFYKSGYEQLNINENVIYFFPFSF